jgi:glucose 1-dehydrogenase
MRILENKVAVITGASRGLGLAIAQAFAREGAAVVLGARSADGIRQVVADLESRGLRAAGQSCDASDPQQVEALARLAEERFGRIDIWVNNAGISAAYGPTPLVDPQTFITTTRVNIFSTYYGSMAALRRFLPQGSGKLINLLGAGSDRPAVNQNAYGSSKVWIRWFSTGLAKEIAGKGIDVIQFNPGLVITDMLTKVEAVKGYGEKVRPLETIMRMWGNPPAVPAQKAVWLASPATDGKNGLTVKILTTRRLIGGALAEGLRRLLGRKAPPSPMTVVEVESPVHNL